MADREDPQVTVDEAPIYQIRLDLKGIRPPIWRRLLLPSDLTLDVIHSVIQVAMGWTNSHLHSFTSDDLTIGDPSMDQWGMDAWGLGTTDERGVMLSDVMEKVGDKLEYEYDFGDSWHHVLKLEKILPVDPDEVYPICVTGRRACPPEDIGGIWGYQNFLDAMADEAHPDHDMMMEWIGGEFDPEAFDPEEITAELQDRVASLLLAGLDYQPLTSVRFDMLSPAVAQLMLTAMPSDMIDADLEDEQVAERIQAAESILELLDAVPLEHPVLIAEWLERLNDFGPKSAPAIADKLAEPGIEDPSDRAWVQERLATALHRLGPPAVPALLDVFDRLDLYGKTVACIALGQLGAKESGDRVWATFEQTFETPENGYFLGPVWALIDLDDPRATEAIARVLKDGWEFDELPAMAGRAGDRRALVPLIQWMSLDELPADSPVGHALTLVAHRIGRSAIIAELAQTQSEDQSELPKSTLAQIADLLLNRSVEEAEAFFATMFTPTTIEDVLSDLDSFFGENVGEEEWDDDWEDDNWDDDDIWVSNDVDQGPSTSAFARLTPKQGGDRAQPRPGRNDPCWCGSGKKYKNCHWHSDQQKELPQAA